MPKLSGALPPSLLSQLQSRHAHFNPIQFTMPDESAAAAAGAPTEEVPEGTSSGMDKGKGAADPQKDVEMDEDDDEDEDEGVEQVRYHT